MDDSQSSFVFLNSGDYDCRNSSLINTTYESILSSTKTSLCKNIKAEVPQPLFSENFTSVLKDCETCISQSLQLIINLEPDKTNDLNQLSVYLEESVCVLQLLSTYIKGVVEAISMSCSNMMTFPIATGNIIKSVYSHCKDSETLYGNNLKIVEKHLQDLFRACHDLQLGYLTILEKHFIFNLTEKEELDVLILAIDINLELGDIVQNLDIKTMAEQWKAFTMICEKHSSHLIDNQIHYKCSKALCTMIQNSIKTSLQMEKDKIVLRSLKIANFTIKILLKICSIFKYTTDKNYEPVMELFIFVYLTTCLHMEEKSKQLTHLMNTNVLVPVENLLRELLVDEQFTNYAYNIQIDEFERDERQLGYIIFVVNTIKASLQKDNIKLQKQDVIQCIFRFIPFGHIWFNLHLKFPNETSASDYQSYGLYELLLANTVALAATMSLEDITFLERSMYEAVLGTDCMSALFGYNLWILVTRLLPRQYVFSQLTSLIQIYEKLENVTLFDKSPQKTHLTYLLRGLFKTLSLEDRMKIYKMYNIKHKRYKLLWCALEMKNLPQSVQSDAEQFCIDKLTNKFDKLFVSGLNDGEEILDMIKTMNLAATTTNNDALRDYIANAWSLLCLKHNTQLSYGDLYKETIWQFDYIRALVELTKTNAMFQSSFHFAKILHSVSQIMEKCSSEIKLVIVDLVCDMSLHLINDENQPFIQSLFVEMFKNILYDTDNKIKNKFYNFMRTNLPNKTIDGIIAEVVSEDFSLREEWSTYTCREFIETECSKEQLLQTFDFEYRHKCIDNIGIEIDSSGSVAIAKQNSSNFDFADIDSLFDTETESEPVCKKVKLNNEDIEEIVTRIENDASLLCNTKENVSAQNKIRIRNVCEKLRNIVD